MIGLSLPAFCQQTGSDEKPVDIPKLIDRLVEITDPHDDYCGLTATNVTFLPLDREWRFNGGMPFRKPAVGPEVLCSIVKQGARAVPYLVEHLTDSRKSKVLIGRGIVGGLSFDRNDRTDPPIATTFDFSGVDDLDEYSATVGDFCFFALGQIINRDFSVVGGNGWASVIIYSPTASPELCSGVRKCWSGLTEQKHRESLIADFLKPDNDNRLIGAAKRLAYYYPDALEPLALKLLAMPRFEPWKVTRFVAAQLYAAKTPIEAKDLLDQFVVQNGSGAREGVLQQLKEDLKEVERYEGNQKTRKPPSYGDKPRKLLVSLYHKKPDIRSTEIAESSAISTAQLERFIEGGLIYDQSDRIDRAIRDLIVRPESNDGLALACMKRLVGRGFDRQIESECHRRIAKLRWANEKAKFDSILKLMGWNRMHVAAERGDLDGIHKIAGDLKLVNSPTPDGRTPLHLAIQAADYKMIDDLLQLGAEINATDSDGLTPAQHAVRNGNYKIVALLGKHGCSAPDILVASALGKIEVIDAILKKDPASLKQRTDADKQTPLHLASIFGKKEAAARLLAAGAPVDSRNEWNITPLYLATGSGATEVMKLLISKGANVRARAVDPPPEPIHVAVSNDLPVATAVLIESGAPVDALAQDGMTPLLIAADGGFADLVDVLLKHGAKVDAKREDGQTAMHLAAERGYLGVVKRLIAAKASINLQDNMGWSPLHRAARKGNVDIVDFLLAHGANPNDKSKFVDERLNKFESGFIPDMTPLRLAVKNGRVEVAKKLIAAKADMNQGSFGDTLLHVAAESGSVEMIRHLIDNGADVNAKQGSKKTGATPLLLAVENERLEAVRTLIAAKSNVNAANEEGETPLHIAARVGQPALIQLLIANGANVNARDKDQETPLDVAKACKNENWVSILKNVTKQP
jgi:ankyrin repeat protein